MAKPAPSTIRSHVFCDSLALAFQGCPHNWTAQVYACLEQHGVRIPVANGAPIAIASFELELAALRLRQSSMHALPLTPAQRPLLGLGSRALCGWAGAGGRWGLRSGVASGMDMRLPVHEGKKPCSPRFACGMSRSRRRGGNVGGAPAGSSTAPDH